MSFKLKADFRNIEIIKEELRIVTYGMYDIKNIHVLFRYLWQMDKCASLKDLRQTTAKSIISLLSHQLQDIHLENS